MTLPRRLAAEALGTAFLLAVVVGSGIMGERLAAGNAAFALQPKWVGALVAVYITSAYWFTASTSLANPAVTLARAATNTFAGICPVDTPAFILAQLIAALLATLVARWFYRTPERPDTE